MASDFNCWDGWDITGKVVTAILRRSVLVDQGRFVGQQAADATSNARSGRPKGSTYARRRHLMRAVQIREFGDPDVMVYEAAPDPNPSPDQALVRVDASAVGHFDVDLRKGVSRLPLTFPHILGSEAVGRIERLPDGYAGDLDVGRRVLIPEEETCGRCSDCRGGSENRCDQGQMLGVGRPGTYAELVAVRADDLLPIEGDLPPTGWAAVQVGFGTAWHMLITRAGLQAGETVLINGVAGGVGSAALQIAKLAGATVIATAGGASKLDRALSDGADSTIDYSSESLHERVLHLTKGRGVDVVFEHIGGDVLVQSLKSLAKGGRVVTCGAHGGEVVPLDVIKLFRGEHTVIGSRTCTRLELERVIQLVQKGDLTPIVDSAFPFSLTADAHRRLESREHYGKVVLVPDGSPPE
jgi:NADPH:quinone reductase-like Zn-dependent oxidoreductase